MEDICNEEFDVVEVLGARMLFACYRLYRSTLPDGLFAYDVRHDDECQGIPCEIKPHVLVNHWGTVLTDTPINFGEEGYILLEDNDWNYTSEVMTITEYIEQMKGKRI